MLSPLQLDIALAKQITKVTRSRYFHNLWLPIQISRRDPQPHFPLHNHDFDEVAYIIKGHGITFMGDRFQLLLPGNVTYLRAEDTHAYPMVDSLRLLNIFFLHDRLIENFPKLRSLVEDFHALQSTNSQLFTDYTAYARLKSLADLLDVETFCSDDYSEYTAMAHLVEFFVLILRQYRRQEDFTLTDPDQLARNKILKLFADPALAEGKCRKDLEALVQCHALSWRSFERILPEMSGLTPHDLAICNRFIAFLNLLLDQPDQTLEDVCITAGFSDYRSMSRNCRQFLKLSPKQVQNMVAYFIANPPSTSDLEVSPS
ncbi:helix-turn-helix transcriptional regulator [uncultured Cohaesibacter sp.]|uniref:AraC family transcriptional regulator n=1 Tax=uncultured Cohaesibacter sp. TaxID=1002546 RepID=UPI002AAB71E5|nr:helix-turn-helix transcriptional regulator [uncultured Cohaesibacter sp.]